MSDSEAQSRVEAAKNHYGYTGFLNNINNNLIPYLDNMKKAQLDYQQMNGIEFVIRNHSAITGGVMEMYGEQYQIDSKTKIVGNETRMKLEFITEIIR